MNRRKKINGVNLAGTAYIDSRLILVHSSMQVLDRESGNVINIEIVHNLNTFNLDIETLFNWWVNQEKKYTAESLIAYIKNMVEVKGYKEQRLIIMTLQQYNRAVR